MLIVFSGLPGTGKTSVARGLAHRLEAMYLRIDSLEQAIMNAGVGRQSLADAGYRAGCAVAEDNLHLGRTVIADAVNPLCISRDAWRDVAERAHAVTIDIEMICSDREEHRRRVENRASDIPGLKTPTWKEVLDREYQPWDRGRILVDTANKSLKKCVSDLHAAVLKQAGPGAP